ncbi:EAL domain-containing protein [Chitinimonas arctica]|uniref:EAL domain-containing protein n=1 Tax=Chitinimonas arctica TaxID=2594795 RepID=A0A516SG06_9NEIS|nr:EAL domain-containing protein [Chitinimonas arctica]QDQ27095.1 EAL domain-containing protein [Chitinimonas arctica]
MRTDSLSFRIVVFFFSLLAVVLLATFVLVSVANLRISRETAAHELLTGERVFRRLLEQNGSQLTLGAQVLARDFGFRDAIATGETDTIVDALRNHGGRIGADLVMLSDLNDRIQADTVRPERTGQPYPFRRLLAKAGAQGGASGIERIDGRLYQLVAVPVRAPATIGWITMGFEINDGTAADLRSLAGLQVSFLGHGRSGWVMLASTLLPEQRAGLTEQLSPEQSASRLVLAGEDYQTRLFQLGDSPEGPIYALLARSLMEALAPFYQLQGTLIVLALIALAVCLLAGTRIARRITDPLRALSRVAERIQQGDYQQQIDRKNSSEIGRLAGSLAHMQAAIGERENRISKLAYEDPLTGLPNRVRFNQLLAEAIEAAARQGSALTVLLVNLDRFQQINDTLGHPMGDRVLAEVGSRLRSSVRQEDSVARLSGDDFALLLPGVRVADAPATLERIHRMFDRRFVLENRPLDLRAGMGAAGFPDHADNAIDLIRSADLAMYRAKRTGERHIIYDPGMQTFREEHLSLLGDLQQAVEHNQLTLYYQPKVNLATGRADEAEALVRWIHPDKGFIPPGEFVPFAEQTGYIREVTRWVLAHAIATAGAWALAGRPVKLSVNLATRDLLDRDLPSLVAELLEQASLSPDYLCLEITESGLMADPAKALAVLQQLRAMGLSIAIDDYGTGYSSLAYIRRLPVTELKIDRAFMIELVHNDSDRQIVRSTVELGHRLGLKVVAEGVEDHATVALLRAMGCDQVQGYVFAKPMPAEDFIRWREALDARNLSADALSPSP